jgi:hypothetical protein
VIGAGVQLAAAEPQSIPGGKGRDLAKSIADVRGEIERLDHEYQQVEVAPAPAGDLRSRALGALDELAARGRPYISTLSRLGDPLDLDQRLRFGSVALPDGRGKLTDDAGAFVAGALRDVLAERIAALFDADPIENALADNERDQRLTDLAKRRLDAERLEEALIVTAEAAGLRIDRRANVDPRAVLNVEDR